MARGNITFGIFSGTMITIGALWLSVVLSNSLQLSFMQWSGLPLPSDPYLEMLSFLILGGLLNFVILNPFQIFALVAVVWAMGGCLAGFASRDAMGGIKAAIGMTLIICAVGIGLFYFASSSFQIELVIPLVSQSGIACVISAFCAAITGIIVVKIGGE